MKPVSVKLNVLANYAAQGWTTVMGLAFVPLYIKYLGIEVYGLMGVFVLLQAIFPLLDLGVSPSLSRQMARFRAGALDIESLRNLLRTVEIVFLGISALIGAGVWASSGWLAASWLNVGRLPVGTVAHAIAVMAFVIGLRFFESIYRGSLIGLQRQVALGAVNAALATVRGAGAAAVLIWVSPTITAFFVWQGVVSILSTIVLAVTVYRSLPANGISGRFSVTKLHEIRAFAGGMAGISISALALTQVDKLLLSKLLPLDQYGYYMLGANIASILYTIVTPISQAYYPRFSELLAKDDQVGLITSYHKAAQLVTVLTGASAFMLIAFGESALHLWTRDTSLAHQAAPLLAVQSLGILLNCLMWIPLQMQLAHGIVGLALRTNLVAIVIVIPAIFWVIPKYGPIGAAWVWVALNAGYLLISVNIMYARIIGTERWRWYGRDLALPLIAILAAGSLCRWGMPGTSARWSELATLAITMVLLLVAATLTAPMLRQQLLALSRRVHR